ncbi:MAG: VOC family protein [Planctomycetes bacterium]|nr:VOC family protein [Planctomycetota bacterium]
MRHALTIFAVEDLGVMRRFYEQACGWPVAVEVPVYVEFALPAGMRFGLYARQGYALQVGGEPERRTPGLPGRTELYLTVAADEFAAALARVRAAGARELSQAAHRDWGDEVAYFADPEGNVLAVARPAPR